MSSFCEPSSNGQDRVVRYGLERLKKWINTWEPLVHVGRISLELQVDQRSSGSPLIVCALLSNSIPITPRLRSSIVARTGIWTCQVSGTKRSYQQSLCLN